MYKIKLMSRKLFDATIAICKNKICKFLNETMNMRLVIILVAMSRLCWSFFSASKILQVHIKIF